MVFWREINRELQKCVLNPRNVWCNLDLFKKMGPKWSPPLNLAHLPRVPWKCPHRAGFCSPYFGGQNPIDGCSWLSYSGTRSPNLFTLPSFRFVENPKTSSSFGAWCFFLLQLSHGSTKCNNWHSYLMPWFVHPSRDVWWWKHRAFEPLKSKGCRYSSWCIGGAKYC